MEYLDGISLSDLIASEGALSTERTQNIVSQICDALEFSHRRGIIHRDLKPSNIILLSNDRVKIVDFGIAKLTSAHNLTTLTGTTDLFGTPQYMSPEQCFGGVVDHRSDIYSLGCIIYEMLTGRPPFLGDTAYATIHKHITEEPADHPNLDNALGDAALAALAKSASDRPQTAADIKSRFQIAAKTAGVSRRKILTGAPQVRRAAFRMLPLAIAAFVLFSLIAALSNRSQPRPRDCDTRSYKGLDFEFLRRERTIASAISSNELEYGKDLLNEMTLLADARNVPYWIERAIQNRITFDLDQKKPGALTALDSQIQRLKKSTNVRDCCELLSQAATVRAEQYMQAGDNASALSVLEDATSSVHGANRDFLLSRAYPFSIDLIILQPEKHNELARKRYDALLAAENSREFKNNPTYLQTIGESFAARNDYATALDAINRGIALTPDFIYLYGTRAKIYDRLGKSALARKDRVTIERLRIQPVNE